MSQVLILRSDVVGDGLQCHIVFLRVPAQADLRFIRATSVTKRRAVLLSIDTIRFPLILGIDGPKPVTDFTATLALYTSDVCLSIVKTIC